MTWLVESGILSAWSRLGCLRCDTRGHPEEVPWVSLNHQFPVTISPAATHLPYPPALQRGGLIWEYVIAFSIYHVVALLAVIPWLFSWTGLITALVGIYIFGTLGINVCYHRLLTHRSFACPRWLEHTLAFLGVCSLQDTPARWVGVHRMHHQHSDEETDPHSPLAGFFWGHMGWLLTPNRELQRWDLYERYSRDLLRDRFYRGLERRQLWVWLNLGQWLLFYVVGFGGGLSSQRRITWRGSVRSEPVGLGRLRPHRPGLAHHLVGQFRNPSVGLSQLCHR